MADEVEEVPGEDDYYKESTGAGDVSPGDHGFSPEGGVIHRSWEVSAGNIETADDLKDLVTDLVGATSDDTTEGRLNRSLPREDPVFDGHYVSKVLSLKGVGLYERSEDIVGGFPQADCFKNYTHYEQYRVAVELTSRPYVLVKNEAIRTLDGTWYNFEGAPQTFRYAEEWLRYTDTTTETKAEAVTAQLGQYKFSSSVEGIDGKGYAARPRLFLPDQSVAIAWLAVPLRYVTSVNSYIRGPAGRSWLGTVNQNDWWIYPRGTLLFSSFKYRKYSPPIPTLVGAGADQRYQQLCDIFLYFIETKRFLEGGETPATEITNLNHVAQGWNLLPDLTDRKFHYAVTDEGEPSFNSSPFELLFTDPDFAQPGVISNW